MNHQEELAAPSVAEFRPILHRMGTPLGAAVLTATVLLAGSTIDAPADTPPTPHVHLAHEATQAASRLNAHVLEITPPQPVYESKAPIAATTKAANSILRQQTYGKYAIKLSRDLLYKMEPDGVISHDGKNRACYSNDLLATLNNWYASRHQLTSSDVIIDVLPEKTPSTCALSDAGESFGTTATGSSQIWILDGYFQDPSVELHELGHVWGLLHQGLISCMKLNDGSHGEFWKGEYPHNAALSFYDIKDLISACGIVKQPGQPDKDDQYASSLSVMGSISSTLSGGYSTPEVNRLDPAAAPIKTVGKHPGTYTLSVENGLRGIAIKLPPEHPLRQADKSLRNVTFTIPGGSPVLAGNPRSPSINPLFRINTVDVIATGKAMSYDIDSMGYDTFLGQQKRIGQEPSDMLRTAAIVDPQQEPIIYLDKTLGIVVTAGRDKESNQIFVRVNDIDSPKSQFKIKYFKQLAHHQSMLIAQAHE